MSRPTAATMARANFKKYTEITNPLASALAKKQSDQGNSREEQEEEEEDPFGLDSIMAQGQSQRTRPDEEEEEEEEDPFGLGAIMDPKTDSGAAASTSAIRSSGEETQNGSRSTPAGQQSTGNKRHADSSGDGGASGDASDDESPRKVRKITTTTTTTGGYFSGTAARSHPEGGRSAGQSTEAVAAAAETKRRPFLKANSFEGARRGYVFQKGRLGLGYYADKALASGGATGGGGGSGGGEKRHAVGGVYGSSGGGGGERRAEPGGEGANAQLGATGSKGGDGPGTTAAAAATTAEGGGKRAPLDVPTAVQKLKVLLVKPKKAAKAASLMANLMEAEMRPENARLFFRALKPLASDPGGVAALAAGEGGARAFRLLVERGSGCFGGGAADGVRAVTWELLFGLRHDVKTDDSFQFARAIKRLRQAIEALGDATGTIDAIDGVSTGADGGNEEAGGGGGGGEGVISLPLERKRAVILIMKEAFKSYHLAWARSSIEPAFKAAADRRRLFPEGEMRDALDGFTDTITKRQRNPGGAMAPPSRSVRAHNSTAHPMLNKRADIIR
eukprot:jgi/Undpi1/2083/HiC_scaffold_12.g05469.m1